MQIILLVISILSYTACHRNNACKTIEDYSKRDHNSNCWYNPNVEASPEELAKNCGFPLDTYEVETEDGFLLTVFRIPNYSNNKKGVVFIQHPLSASAMVWMDKGNDSLGVFLHRAGYDVWLGNFRGNVYTKHKLYNDDDKEYWNHSFHEMGIYDLPAMLSFVKKNTNNSRLHYIGHSMGTTTAFVYSSLLPDHAGDTVRSFIMISPIAFHSEFPTILTLSGPLGSIIQRLLKISDTPYVVTSRYNGFFQQFIKWACFNFPGALPLCLTMVVQLTNAGSNYNNISPEWYPHLFKQNFQGYSVKTALHFQQNSQSRKFQYYNYGSRNREMYGSHEPPSYPLEAIKVPTGIIWGGDDHLNSKNAILKLQSALPQSSLKYGVTKIDNYTHIDFLYAKDVRERMYEPILKILSFTDNNNSNNLN